MGREENRQSKLIAARTHLGGCRALSGGARRIRLPGRGTPPTHNPQGISENLHIERMIDCRWRLRQVPRVETGICAAGLAEGERKADSPDRSARSALLGRVSTRRATVLSQLSRYERQIERSFNAECRELLKEQYARTMDADLFFVNYMGRFKAPVLSAPKQEQEGSFHCGTLAPQSAGGPLSSSLRCGTVIR